MKPVLLFICLCVIVHISLVSQVAAAEANDKASDYNGMRDKYAKKQNIQDMNTLKYSDELEQKAKDLPCEAKHGSDYRVFLHPTDDDPDTAKVIGEMNEKLKEGKLQEMKTASNFSFVEVYEPKQKYVGCTRRQCNVPVRVPSGEVKKLKFLALCVMGPIGDIQSRAPPSDSDTNPPTGGGDTKKNGKVITNEDDSDPYAGKGPQPPSDPSPPAPEITSTPPTSSSSSISFCIIPLIFSFVLIV